VLERRRERETRRKGQEVREGGRKRGREGGPCERHETLDRPEASLERFSIGVNICLPDTLIELSG
jgi:hypothetical protein